MRLTANFRSILRSTSPEIIEEGTARLGVFICCQLSLTLCFCFRLFFIALLLVVVQESLACQPVMMSRRKRLVNVLITHLFNFAETGRTRVAGGAIARSLMCQIRMCRCSCTGGQSHNCRRSESSYRYSDGFTNAAVHACVLRLALRMCTCNCW